MLDDAELLRRYASTQDDQAFAEVVRRHIDGVYSAALRRLAGDTHLAEDVTQHVFLVLAQKAHVAARQPTLSAWLYTITRYEAAHTVRREQRRKAREHEAHDLEEVMHADEHHDWSHVAPLLDELLDQLPERDRAAILLRFVERRGFAEIGTALRVSTDAARMRVDRALDRLRVLLQRRGVTSSTAALGLTLSANMAVAAPASLSATVATAVSTSALAATSVTTAGLLPFMSTTKVTVVIAAIAIGFACFEYRSASKARAALSVAEEGEAALNRQVTEAAGRIHAAEATIAQLRAASVTASAPTQNGAAPTSPTAAGVLAANKLEAEMQFLTDPELQRISQEQYKASLAVRYGQLYTTLGLSGPQVTEFERLMAMRHEAEMALGRERILNKLSKTDPAFLAKKDAAIGPLDRDLQALLSDSGYKEYQQFEQTFNVRGLVEAVAGSVFYTDTPLTAQQGQQLAQLLATTNARQRGGRAEWTDINWDAFTSQASQLLSATQLATVKSLRDQAQLQQASARRMAKPQ